MVMGHEFSAQVEALGEGCEGLAVGDIVSVQPCLSCFECDFCKSGHTQRCEKKTFLRELSLEEAPQVFEEMAKDIEKYLKCLIVM